MTKSTSSRRGCDALLQALQTAGVQKIFTLSGNHIMPVFDAAFGAGIALIHTRHEAAAVHMADAYARLTGEVGIALVTGGPGHANAVSALYTAQMAEAPVVLLSGHAPQRAARQGRVPGDAAGRHGGAGLQGGLDRARAPMRWPTTWRVLFRIARSGRPGPVHLSLPTDVLDNGQDDGAPVADAFEPDAMPLSTKSADAPVAARWPTRRARWSWPARPA